MAIVQLIINGIALGALYALPRGGVERAIILTADVKDYADVNLGLVISLAALSRTGRTQKSEHQQTEHGERC